MSQEVIETESAEQLENLLSLRAELLKFEKTRELMKSVLALPDLII